MLLLVPSWVVRCFCRISQIKAARGIEPQCGSFSLTLYVEVSLVLLATLDATARGADVSADVGCHTALGIFFRLQVVDFDIRFLFLVSACLLFILCRVVC